ncbi:MAG: 4-Cys prefix domain-containing protein [Crocosphaera sp.]
MSYCLNPVCPQPQNIDDDKFCQTCGSKLFLKERYRAIKPENLIKTRNN